MTTLRLLIADDHGLFRRGLRQACEEADLVVAGEAQNGQEAVEMARLLKPDVILIDIHMPLLDGLSATRQIIQEQPDIGVIILTVFRDEEHVFEAIQAGARGYLMKDTDEEALVQAIQVVARGEALIEPVVAARVLSEFRRLSQARALSSEEHLTTVEMDILRLLAQGEENPAIADRLGISEKTVINRLTTIYQKIHVNNRTQAALYALRQGWATVDSGGAG
jgi:NarL family two-component system response regulator LiaR